MSAVMPRLPIGTLKRVPVFWRAAISRLIPRQWYTLLPIMTHPITRGVRAIPGRFMTLIIEFNLNKTYSFSQISSRKMTCEILVRTEISSGLLTP
jgi:hypothetical protein